MGIQRVVVKSELVSALTGRLRKAGRCSVVLVFLDCGSTWGAMGQLLECAAV